MEDEFYSCISKVNKKQLFCIVQYASSAEDTSEGESSDEGECRRVTRRSSGIANTPGTTSKTNTRRSSGKSSMIDTI